MLGRSSPTPVATRIRRADSVLPPGESDGEAGLDVDDVAGDEFDAVARDLCAADGEELGWWHSVTGEKPLHVSGGCVAWHSGVDDGDAPPRPSEDERGAQAGCSTADHDDVVAVGVHRDHRHAACRVNGGY